MDKSKIRFFIFDTFGTVVDWHGSIVKEGMALGDQYGFTADWHKFANDWREEGYLKMTPQIVAGTIPYETVDSLLMQKLKDLTARYGFPKLSDEEYVHLNNVWRRLLPWPDVLDGLNRLKEKYSIGPFSNGDFRLILEMAKYSRIPWDFIGTTDIFKTYKPDPKAFEGIVRLLGAAPEEVCMVAAHTFDLDGAKRLGCMTCYVPRPMEYGPNSNHMDEPGILNRDFDLNDFRKLAELFDT